jgi:hypothetical protein
MALLVTLLKLPLAMKMALASGAASDVPHALAVCGPVAAIAMATTVLCHAQLRFIFGRRASGSKP